MASGKHNIHTSSLKPNDVSKNLITGTFALKWPEENTKSLTPIAVNLHVDYKGYILFCLNKVTKEIECFDIALIHDTRTGKYATPPKDAIKCEQMNIGADVPLEDKWVTIYYGQTFVPDKDLRTIHFCFYSPSLAKEWTDELFRYARNPFLRNLSGLDLLEKIHSKIVNGLVEERQDRKTISVRNILRMFCKNSRDTDKEQRILKALQYTDLAHERDALINPEQFTFDKFFSFYTQLMERNEIDKLLEKNGSKRTRIINREQLKNFIETQSNTRGDGIIDYDQKAKDIIKKYMRDTYLSQNVPESICDEAFLRYLLSFDNLIIDPAKLDLYQDMDKPLSHYFIASSHNTYLMGSQLHGRSSVEMYRQVLLTGCRCIELDILDSPDGEPEIKHRNTMIRSISFRDVIEAIDQYAFKVTPYPLILSFENHCSERVQTKMANYLIEIFGDKMLTQPLKSHPLEEKIPLPSPNDLINKILIKNKILRGVKTTSFSADNIQRGSQGGSTSLNLQRKRCDFGSERYTASPSIYMSVDPGQFNPSINNPVRPKKQYYTNIQQYTQSIDFDPKSDSSDEELFENSSYEDVNLTDPRLILNENPRLPTTVTQTVNLNNDAVIESKATKAMSDLVNYVTPVRFKGFGIADQLNYSYECSSFNEDKGQNLIRENAMEFVIYNERQLSRVYPRGTRIESTNYNPYQFWSVGCQMVALNYQTLDTPMQINLGMFEYNKRCGYLQKPTPYCLRFGTFDPQEPTSIENVVVEQLSIKLISGQFLIQDHEPVYVDVEMYGIYADASKRRERIKSKRWNGFQAIYDDNDNENDLVINFSKINLPEMASLRFAVSEEDGTFIGQAFIPVSTLRSGYRHIVLRNQSNVPVHSSTLFIYSRIEVHVDAACENIVDSLMNPLEKKELISSPDQYQPNLNENKQDDPSKTQQYTTTITIKHNNTRQPSSSVDENGSRNQFVKNTQLKNTHLCYCLTIKDVQQMKFYIQEQEKLKDKLRKAAASLDKKIEIEEEKFRKNLQRLNLEQRKNEKYITTKPIRHMSDAEIIHHSQTHNIRKTSLIMQKAIAEDVKSRENRLLDLCSLKFRSLNELEVLHSKNFYNKVERYIIDYYGKLTLRVDEIFRQETAKIKDQVRIQTRNDTKKKLPNAKDGRRPIFNNKILQMNVEAGAAAIRKLETLYNSLCETIAINLRQTLEALQIEREAETKNRFLRYAAQINEIKTNLNLETFNDDNLFNCSILNSALTSSLPRETLTSAHSSISSTLNIVHLQSNRVTLPQEQQQSQEQTDTLIQTHYLNENEATTRF